LDYVLFLRGRVAANDGTTLPNNVLVERICNERVRQQVYATIRGDFNMQLGSTANSFVDASGDPGLWDRSGGEIRDQGIPRRELMNCDLRVTASGFRPGRISLVDLSSTSFGSLDVGAIVVQRTAKIKGATVSAAPYRAPEKARKAYEKGLEAANGGKLAIARSYFEKAVQIYPKFANAWFELGTVLQEQHQTDAAREAFVNAASADTKFLPPYLPLAIMAYEAGNWTEVLNLTNHVLDLEPLKHPGGYTLDLDKFNYADAYFYQAAAYYQLNRIDEAEKSALQAERALRTRTPQLRLLLGEIFARKGNYAAAISELQAYLQLAPHAKEADLIREQLASLEKLQSTQTKSEQPNSQ
jgi:tetratricopeptide repeat protein